MSYAKIRPRRGTLYEWSTVNPVLYEGELGIEVPDSGVGTGLSKFKIGDGITAYNELPYAFDGAAANSIEGGGVSSSHNIQLRRGYSEEWESTNPILADGEIAVDIDTYSIKIGNGYTEWNKLEFINARDVLVNDFDFGNEDDDDIIGNDGTVLYPDIRFKSSPITKSETSNATLSDLIE